MKRSLILLSLVVPGVVVAQGVLPCVNGGTCSLTSLTVNGSPLAGGSGPDAGDGLAYVHGGDTLACNFATGSIDGCWSTTTQTLRGDKTLLGDAGLNSFQCNAENINQSSGGGHVALKIDSSDCIDVAGNALGSACFNSSNGIVLGNNVTLALGAGASPSYIFGNAGAITIHSPNNTNVNSGALQVAGNNVQDTRINGSCSAGQFVSAINNNAAPTCGTPAGGGGGSFPDAGDGLQYVHSGDTLACVPASGTLDGCVSIATQTLRGDKTLLGDAGMNNLNVSQIVVTGAAPQITASVSTLAIGYASDTFLQLNNGGSASIATNGHNFGIGNTVVAPAYKLDLRDANGSQSNAVFHAGQATSGAVDTGLYYGMDSSTEGILMHNMDFNPSNGQTRAKAAFAESINFNSDGSIAFTSNTGLTAGNTFSGTENLGIDKIKGIYTGSPLTTIPVTSYVNGSAVGTATYYAIESGRAAASSASLTVTLHFSSGTPTCICNDEAATPQICGPTGPPTSSSVTFKEQGGNTDIIDWTCQGVR